jgi:putative ABC transport system permease protein
MSVVSRFLNLFRSEALQHDLDAEVQFHLQKRIERNLFYGMSRAEAEAEAYRRFGNVARVTEDMREARVMTWLESLTQDFRYGFRSLWRARLSSSAMT